VSQVNNFSTVAKGSFSVTNERVEIFFPSSPGVRYIKGVRKFDGARVHELAGDTGGSRD